MPRDLYSTAVARMTAGVESVDVPGKNVREAIDALDGKFPGIAGHLCDGDSLRGDLTVVIDADVSPRGLLQKLNPESEVHFLPPIGGG